MFKLNCCNATRIPLRRRLLMPSKRSISTRLFELYYKMVREPPAPDSDWDRLFTNEELETFDAMCRSATSISQSTPIKKLHVVNFTDDHDSTVSPPKIRRRLPDSLFTFRKEVHTSSSLTPCSSSRFHTAYGSSYEEMKFGGRIIYSRTVEEVEKDAVELLHFIEAKRRKEGKCILGLDLEWKPSFRRGVAPGKAAVMQICGENNSCHVMHIIHSGIPKNLQRLLEDPTAVKVGIGIAGDMTKVFKDHNVSTKALEDLSNLANRKLGGDPKQWSLASLTEMLVCRLLPKSSKIQLGNWEVEVLSKEQLKYAATDAYASWYLYQVSELVQKLRQTIDIVEAHTPQHYNWSGYKILSQVVRDLKLKLHISGLERL